DRLHGRFVGGGPAFAATPRLFLPLDTVEAVAGGIEHVPNIDDRRPLLVLYGGEVALDDLGCAVALRGDRQAAFLGARGESAGKGRHGLRIRPDHRRELHTHIPGNGGDLQPALRAYGALVDDGGRCGGRVVSYGTFLGRGGRRGREA